jgi:hypothetical protein
LALTLDSALALLATTLETGFFSDSELSEESSDEEAAAFLETLATGFLASALAFLFLESSTDCFLDGASDELDDDDATTFFCKNIKVNKHSQKIKFRVFCWFRHLRK